MKKSEALHKAQLAVLTDQSIPFEETLEVLAFLMDAEKTAKFSERQREKENETV